MLLDLQYFPLIFVSIFYLLCFLLRIKTTIFVFIVLNVCENLFVSYPDYDYVNEQALFSNVAADSR